MSNIYCAPDLPFWETVVWQVKQIIASLVIVSVILAVVLFFWFGFVFWLNRGSKK